MADSVPRERRVDRRRALRAARAAGDARVRTTARSEPNRENARVRGTPGELARSDSHLSDTLRGDRPVLHLHDIHTDVWHAHARPRERGAAELRYDRERRRAVRYPAMGLRLGPYRAEAHVPHRCDCALSVRVSLLRAARHAH